MKQVILNLFQNAIDATPPDGSVTVETRSGNGTIVISVKDTGSGIGDEDLSRIFEPFFTTKVTGVGLGLSIIKKIINDHNGEIAVSSSRDGGSEFIITLPVPK